MKVRKSVSAEVNYGIRFTEEQELNNFLNQLCTEVQHRLLEISAKGKTITLKYMVRAKDAPVETAKFMGHGFCDNVTRSVTLATYTCDLTVISQTVFNIKNVLNVPCEELRGIGIQISKLNTVQNEGNKKNPLKNMFENFQAKQKLNSCSNDSSAINQINEFINSDSQSERKLSLRRVQSFNDTPTRDMVGKPKLNISNRKSHKIYDELDLSVLAQLPNDIQEEILLEKNLISKEETNDQSLRPTVMKKVLARKLENDFYNIDKEFKKTIYQRNPSIVSTFNMPHNRINEIKIYSLQFQYISQENILNSTEWRQILSHWLDNDYEPDNGDVQMILKYFQEFARAQKLCELITVCRYLYR